MSETPAELSHAAETEPAYAFNLTLPSESTVALFMADLAIILAPGDILTLSGDLGSGKTTCARALIRYFAGDPMLDVPSPTFTLVQPYDTPGGTLVHADLYRISDPAEIEELDLFDEPRDAIRIIEWPERAGYLLPKNRLDLHLSLRPGQSPELRSVRIAGFGTGGARAERLAALLNFIGASGHGLDARARVAGDASSRSYARLSSPAGSVLLMNSPRRPDGPAIHDGKSYSAAVHLAEDVVPFIAIAHGLREHGFSAPAIHRADTQSGFLVLEDFGGERFVAGEPPLPIAERYEIAVDMLAALHGDTLPARVELEGGAEYTLPTYDLDAFLIEASLLLDWYMPDRGAPIEPATRDEFEGLWRQALAPALEGEQAWVLRDFHSPNLIWLGERPDTARVGLIDFQDAVIGPSAYDVASLLQDARVDVSESLEIALLTRYAASRRMTQPAFDAKAFVAIYALMAAQRATKILGIFARLNRRDGKSGYLRHQPRVYAYLQRALAHPDLAPLKSWYDARVPGPHAG